ncbi:hypothetical protein KKI24_12130 [bacterium]|nr:hypothetical protein [bacterium]
MIELTIHMNSDIVEVLEWKCCNISGLNLELIFHNVGKETVPVPDSFFLENSEGREYFSNIYPPWPQKILPRDYASIYCNMDDETWQKYQSLIIKDEKGIESSFPINHR